MNKVILMGRLTRDPDIRQGQGENAMLIARYTLAVDRRFRKNGADQQADFINIVAFGKSAEFIEKYARKGTKLVVSGRIQTGSYTNKDGQKVYTTDIVAEDQEFAESKSASGGAPSEYVPVNNAPAAEAGTDGFVNVPDGFDDELPFN